MSIIHASGVCLVTEESSDEFTVQGMSSEGPRYTLSRAYVFGREVWLSKNESDILELFMTNPGILYTRDEILDMMNDAGDISERSVDSIIKRIRKKLFPYNAKAGLLFIKTVYCIGYKISKRKLISGN